VPQIDENQASPAADTFTRRFAAAALDVMFVAMPAMLLAATSAERFSIIEETGVAPDFRSRTSSGSTRSIRD
jgi:hypothetical protein